MKIKREYLLKYSLNLYIRKVILYEKRTIKDYVYPNKPKQNIDLAGRICNFKILIILINVMKTSLRLVINRNTLIKVAFSTNSVRRS